MKGGILIISVIIVGALLAMAVMVKYATDIKVEDRQRSPDDPAKMMFQFKGQVGVISLNQNSSSLAMSQRFPYVVAITRNYSSTWSFTCFASLILVKWVVTSAHCRKTGATHRVLLYHDFVRNLTHTYPILFWKIHEEYNDLLPASKYDIAIAKLNTEGLPPIGPKSSFLDEGAVSQVVASVWKTVSTMDKKLFLTNDFESFPVTIAPNAKCVEIFGITLDDSVFCVDMTAYKDDCFTNEFGPIYSDDKVVGIVTVKPRDCDIKFAVFTNVSYYTNWILRSTRTTHFG